MPLLAYRRCLAHFAVDPELVYVTTHLAGPKTRFLPFNQGRFGGAGNPPVPPTQDGYATAYPRFLILPWIHILNLGSHILAIVRHRLHEDWTERYKHHPRAHRDIRRNPALH